VNKELEDVVSGIAHAVLGPAGGKDVVPGLDGLPCAVDVSLALAGEHENGVQLRVVGVDRDLHARRNLQQGYADGLGELVVDKHGDPHASKSEVIGICDLWSFIKLGLHVFSPTDERGVLGGP